MNLKKLSEHELENLLQHQFRVLYLLSNPEFVSDNISRRELESLQDEALDKIILIKKEIQKRKNDGTSN